MLKLLFSPFGAIHRLQFLFGLIIALGLIFIALGLIMLPSLAFVSPAMLNMMPILTIIAYSFAAVATFASTWCSICIHLKRLYDLRVTRFLILLPIACGFVDRLHAVSYVPLIMQILILIYMAVLLFWPSRRIEPI